MTQDASLGIEDDSEVRQHRGFALIEVMVAGIVAVLGLLAIFALQFAAMESNARAMQFTEGTNLAGSHIELLKREALMWNNNTLPDPDIDSTTMPNLSRGLASPAAALASLGWVTVPYHDAGEALNARGEPGLVTDPGFVYCIHQRVTYLSTLDPNGVFFPETLRIEVRVLWPRNFTENFAAVYPDCGSSGPQTMADDLASVASLTIPTVIRMSPAL